MLINNKISTTCTTRADVINAFSGVDALVYFPNTRSEVHQAVNTNGNGTAQCSQICNYEKNVKVSEMFSGSSFLECAKKKVWDNGEFMNDVITVCLMGSDTAKQIALLSMARRDNHKHQPSKKWHFLTAFEIAANKYNWRLTWDWKNNQLKLAEVEKID